MKTFVQGLRPNRDEITDAGFSIALVGAALAGFRLAYGGLEFLIVGVAAAVVAVLAAYILLKRQVSLFPAMAVVLGIFILFAGPLALSSETLLFFIPTPDSFVALVDGMTRGWARLLTTAPPTGGIDQLLVIPYALGFFGGLISFVLARRAKGAMVVLIPSLVISVVSILFGTRDPAALLVQGALYLVLALLWMSIRRERARGIPMTGASGRPKWIGIALMLVLVAVGAMILGPVIPLADARVRLVLRERIEPPFDPRDYTSPLGSFRKFRVDMANDTLFVVDGVPEGDVRIRLAAMDEYDGVVWNVGGGGRSGAGYFERVGEAITGSDGTDPFVATIEIDQLGGVWVPTFGATTKLVFESERSVDLASSFRFNRISRTAAVPLLLDPGDRYELTEAPEEPPSVDVLRATPIDKSIVLEEVVGLPAEFGAAAADIVAGATNPYDQASAMEVHFQAGAYSDGGPDAGRSVPPGHSIGRIISFFEDDQLVGDGEQYAAAMALMARSLGLPARVVIGYDVPGGAGPIAVRGEDIEAWVEIAFDGLGWVPFSPTPDEANAPQESIEKQKQRTQVETQVPPPISNPPHVDDPVLEDLDELEEEEEAKPPPEPAAELPDWAKIVSAGIAIPFVLISVFVLGVWLLKRRRTRRRQREGDPATRISAGWTDLVDLAEDQRRQLTANATRLEAGSEIGGGAVALATRADSDVFGRRDPGEDEALAFWNGVGGVKKEMSTGRGIWESIRATASMRSLRARNRK